MKTFKQLCKFAEEEQEGWHSGIFIGGGEPTLHKYFWEFLGLAMGVNAPYTYDIGLPAVGLVTNGSNSEMALKLARLAEHGNISCALSRDQFHDSIDPRVYAAFNRHRRDAYGRQDEHDHRSINGERSMIYYAGRAKRIPKSTWERRGFRVEDGCGPCGFHVTPDGQIWECGCKKLRIGDVWSGLNYEILESIGRGTDSDNPYEATCTVVRELEAQKEKAAAAQEPAEVVEEQLVEAAV